LERLAGFTSQLSYLLDYHATDSAL